METKFSKKPLVITLTAAFIGILGASPLALADESSSTPAAEPAPATEPAADATTAPAEGAAPATEPAADATTPPAEGAAPTTP